MIEFIATYWYYPLMVLLIGTGILLTIKLKGVQFRKLPKALKLMFGKENSGKGEVSSFQALCISLSATIGTGNIIGVASAIAIGGPGALFWMLIVSIIGLATKYAEGYLAIKYRKVNPDGSVIGGPYAYIEYGLGKKWKPLAKIFALFGSLAAVLGTGTMTQSNAITESISDVCGTFMDLSYVNVFNMQISIVSLVAGVIITILSILVLFGGIKRISTVCEKVVPFMAILYLFCAILIIALNIKAVPGAFKDIFYYAFNTKSVVGAFSGYTIMRALTCGVQKGIFANEAGLGSTPIALASAKSDDPVKEGLVSMGGMFVTILICTLTGLMVCITGAYSQGLEGIHITNYAFVNGLSFNTQLSSILLLLAISFFAFTTIIGWEIYGSKCIGYLFNNNKIMEKIYLCIYIVMVFLGAYLKINLIWSIADVFNTFMAIPNLIAIIILTKTMSKESNSELYINNNDKNFDNTNDKDNILNEN